MGDKVEIEFNFGDTKFEAPYGDIGEKKVHEAVRWVCVMLRQKSFERRFENP